MLFEVLLQTLVRWDGWPHALHSVQHPQIVGLDLGLLGLALAVVQRNVTFARGCPAADCALG
jgi:hypothetical protein